MTFHSVVAVGILLCTGSASAAGLGEPIEKIGSWSILRAKDPMTDAVTCTAIYQGNLQVQLTLRNLAIGLRGRGGVLGYTIRLDDRPAGQMKLASRVEKNVGAAIIEENDFVPLLQAKRVRFQALTALSTLVNEDLDFSRVKTVLATLAGSKCNS